MPADPTTYWLVFPAGRAHLLAEDNTTVCGLSWEGHPEALEWETGPEGPAWPDGLKIPQCARCLAIARARELEALGQ